MSQNMARKLSASKVAGAIGILGLGLALGSCGPQPPVAGEAETENPLPAESAASMANGTATEPGTMPVAALLNRVDLDQFLVDPDAGGYAFTSADGMIECMFSAIDRPDAMINGFLGGCNDEHSSAPDQPTVFMVTGPGRPGSFATQGQDYPGRWRSGQRALEPGEYVDVGGQVACFSGAADTIGCLEYATGEGYQLVGGDFHPFRPEQLGEIFATGDGTTQLLSRRVVFDLDHGEELTCRVRAGVLACHGGIWHKGTDPGGDAGEEGQSDMIWYDAVDDDSTQSPGVAFKPDEVPPLRAQRVGPGRYLMGAMVVVNSGDRLEFTRPGGSSFWVSPHGHGGELLETPDGATPLNLLQEPVLP